MPGQIDSQSIPSVSSLWSNSRETLEEVTAQSAELWLTWQARKRYGWIAGRGKLETGFCRNKSLTPLRGQRRLTEIDAELMDFIIQFPESDLEKSKAYTTTEGKSHTNLFQHMFTHLLNHSTYHPGQLASLLRQAGAVPNPTDLIIYYRQIKTPLS